MSDFIDHVNPDGKDASGASVPVALLHVYGQFQWHDDCFVVGNIEGLRRMRDALSAAIDEAQFG